MLNVQSFGADGGRDNGLVGCHGFVDFQSGSASDAQGHDHHGGLLQMFDHGGDAASNFDRVPDRVMGRVRGPFLNATVRIAAHDAKSRLGDFRLDRGPDFSAKKFDAVDVRLPVHGADEGNQRRGWRIWVEFGRGGAILREIDSGRNDGNAVAIHPLRHEGAIVFGNGDDVLELANCGALIAEHFSKFRGVDHFLHWIARGIGMAAPDFAFHIVLEEHAGSGETSGEVDGGIEEVANGNVEPLLAEPGLDFFPDFGVSEAADGIGRVGAEMRQIVEAARGSREFAFAGADGHRAGQLPPQLALIVSVGRSSIVRVERKLMPRGQISQDVVRADIAAVLHGKELIGFDPENFHARSASVSSVNPEFSEPRV